MNRLLLLLSLLFLGFVLQAQTISLVQQIDTPYSAPPVTEYKEFGGALYLAAGKNLWKTDGTNTTLIKRFPYSGIYALTIFNNKLYFLASDSAHGLELWNTSGTPVSTAIVKDIFPGKGDGFDAGVTSTSQIRIMQGSMYFIANDSLHGAELYKSDGTAAGTHIVKDIDPAPGQSGAYGSRTGFEVFNNRLYFSGYPTDWPGPQTQWGLWSSDGTDTGTHFIYNTMDDNNFFVYANKLFFSSSSMGFSFTDGTAAGTLSLNSAIDSSYNAVFPAEYAILNGKLYFTASDNYIYVTDGTIAGTQKFVSSLGKPTNYSGAGVYHNKGAFLTTYNNRIYYSDHGSLWSSDGTVAGTTRIIPATNVGMISSPVQLVVAYGKLYFKSADSQRAELWVSDGTNAGTYSIRKPGATLSGPVNYPLYYNRCGIRSNIYPFNNQLFYLGAYDSSLYTQLYKLDLAPNAVPQVINEEGIRLYPNPTTGLLNVSVDKAGFDHITATDQLGRQVLSRNIMPGEQNISLQLGRLPAGLYYLNFSGKHNHLTKKVSLQQ